MQRADLTEVLAAPLWIEQRIARVESQARSDRSRQLVNPWMSRIGSSSVGRRETDEPGHESRKRREEDRRLERNRNERGRRQERASADVQRVVDAVEPVLEQEREQRADDRRRPERRAASTSVGFRASPRALASGAACRPPSVRSRARRALRHASSIASGASNSASITRSARMLSRRLCSASAWRSSFSSLIGMNGTNRRKSRKRKRKKDSVPKKDRPSIERRDVEVPSSRAGSRAAGR